MKYLALVYYDENVVNAMSKEEWEALNGECYEGVERLKASGNYIDGAPLHPIATATTVRVRGEKVSATDGPFAETKEQLAGFYMLEAKDLNEAVEIAGKIPPARLGSIEIRPVRELKKPDDTDL